MPQNLVNLTVPTPAGAGLNTQEESTVLGSEWATKLTNFIFDDIGRPAARKGYQYTNTTQLGSAPEVKQIHEYVNNGGVKTIIAAAGNAIYKVDGTSLTDISGTITTPTADNWKFVNFNGKCIGFQDGHAPIVLATAGGTFADIALTGTNQPTSSASDVLAAYGRLWALDGMALKYSDSLDETAWNGVFDLSTVWLAGTDIPTAVAEFNGFLVVFGESSIIVYSNPWVPTGGGGIDTSTMELVENIAGIGCIARDSVAHVNGDILFLSQRGVRSLGRTIQEKSMPMRDISKNISDEITRLVKAEQKPYIKATYAPHEGFYLLSLPVEGAVYYFDTRQPMRDGSFRCTRWDVEVHSLCSSLDNEVYFGMDGYTAKYSGYLDGKLADGTGGSAYSLEYLSSWLDLGEEVSQYLKIPKKFDILFYGGRTQTAVIKWAFDFNSTFKTRNKTIVDNTTGSEWNIAEYNIGEWSGGISFYPISVALSGSGRVIKLGLTIQVSGETVAMQQIGIKAKVGRMA